MAIGILVAAAVVASVVAALVAAAWLPALVLLAVAAFWGWWVLTAVHTIERGDDGELLLRSLVRSDRWTIDRAVSARESRLWGATVIVLEQRSARRHAFGALGGSIQLNEWMRRGH